GALVSEVIEHLVDDVGALKAVAECLREGGILVLTVPNKDRLVSVVREALGMRPRYMSPDHLREYATEEILQKLRLVGFEPFRLREVCLTFPKDGWVSKVFSPYHPLRTMLLRKLPHLATYLLISSSLTRLHQTEGTTMSRSVLMPFPSG